MTTRKGPLKIVTVQITCKGCEYLKSKYYFIEDGNSEDSGYDSFCMALDGREISNFDAYPDTPDWCPFLDKI